MNYTQFHKNLKSRGCGKSAYAKVAFMKDLLHAPFIMFITSVLFHVVLYLPNYDDIFIVAKGEQILNVSGGHLVALKCFVCFYYTQACTNTYIFSPKHALQIFDSHKIPVNATELGSTFCDQLRSRSQDRKRSQKCASI